MNEIVKNGGTNKVTRIDKRTNKFTVRKKKKNEIVNNSLKEIKSKNWIEK